MQETYELKVHLACDEDTGRWYIVESDIPGLWIEADDPGTLIDRISEAAPELIELNEEEILGACRARADAKLHIDGGPRLRHSILPVFDSPLSLAYA